MTETEPTSCDRFSCRHCPGLQTLDEQSMLAHYRLVHTNVSDVTRGRDYLGPGEVPLSPPSPDLTLSTVGPLMVGVRAWKGRLSRLVGRIEWTPPSDTESELLMHGEVLLSRVLVILHCLWEDVNEFGGSEAERLTRWLEDGQRSAVDPLLVALRHAALHLPKPDEYPGPGDAWSVRVSLEFTHDRTRDERMTTHGRLLDRLLARTALDALTGNLGGEGWPDKVSAADRRDAGVCRRCHGVRSAQRQPAGCTC